MTLQEYLTTKEVADLLRVKERKVYDMASENEIPHRRVTGKLLFPRTELEAWLSGQPASLSAIPDVVAGSHDPLLDWAIRESGSGLATMFDGSLDGVRRVADRQASVAGIHVFEPERRDWNKNVFAQELAGRPVVLVEWARRQQGVILSPDLDRPVHTLRDLQGCRISRRQPTAGAALLFDHLIQDAGLSPENFDFLPELARTETEAAAAVSAGQADAAPGLQAVAQQFNLQFLPTMEERFDLIIDRKAWFDAPFQRLLSFTSSTAFRNKAEHLGGYGMAGLGTVILNNP